MIPQIYSFLFLLLLFFKQFIPNYKKPIFKSNNYDIYNIGNRYHENGNRYNRNVSEKTKKFIASKQKWTCNICHNLLDYTYEIDHIKPLYKGGNNDVYNLQALCRNCHGNKTFIDSIKVF